MTPPSEPTSTDARDARRRAFICVLSHNIRTTYDTDEQFLRKQQYRNNKVSASSIFRSSLSGFDRKQTGKLMVKTKIPLHKKAVRSFAAPVCVVGVVALQHRHIAGQAKVRIDWRTRNWRSGLPCTVDVLLHKNWLGCRQDCWQGCCEGRWQGCWQGCC